MNHAAPATSGQPAQAPVKQRSWGRRMVISWLFFAVAFPLLVFVYGPIATPFLARAGSPSAMPAEELAALVAVLAVGDVLLLMIFVGLLGVLVCGLCWYRDQRRILLRKSAAA